MMQTTKKREAKEGETSADQIRKKKSRVPFLDGELRASASKQAKQSTSFFPVFFFCHLSLDLAWDGNSAHRWPLVSFFSFFRLRRYYDSRVHF